MVTQVRINKNKIYHLSKWNPSVFNADSILYVQANDFAELADSFSNIELIEIFTEGRLMSSYESFEKYSEISFIGKMYVEGEKIFADTFIVRLTKTDLMGIIDRIEKSISGEVDTDSMDLSEFKEFKKSQVNSEYISHLENGEFVVFKNGTTKLFPMGQMDQLEIMNMYSVTMSGGSQVETVPYHGVQYSVEDVKAIYTTLQKFVAAANIRLEIVKNLINTGLSKESIEDYSFSMEFDPTTQQEYDTLYGNALANIGLIGNAESEGVDEFLNIVYDGE